MTSGSEHEWAAAAQWWLTEGSSDPVYAETVLPLLGELLDPALDGVVLDLGCGDGSVAAALDGVSLVGVDATGSLLSVARHRLPVVQARLPHLEWVRDGAVAGALAVLVIEHIPDLGSFLASVARVVTPGGALVIVSNHPAYTAPGSGPVIDMSDGEVLWRWGPYFSEAVSVEPAGDTTVTFHHRPLGWLLGCAADAGWALERFVEVPLGPRQIASQPGYAGQEHMPRLFGARWRRGGG